MDWDATAAAGGDAQQRDYNYARTYTYRYALRPLKRLRLIALLRLHLHYIVNDVVRDLPSNYSRQFTLLGAKGT